MSAVVNPFRPTNSSVNLRRQIINVLSIVATTAFAGLGLIFLTYLIVYVARQGLQYLNVAFFTQAPHAAGEPGGGVGPAIVGSAILIGLASLIGVPLGLFTGVFLSEFGHGWLANAVRFTVDTLTGIPTIIFGLFAWILIVVPAHSFSAFSGGVALGIIMIPTVARASEEVLRLVPRDIREASVALGATESATIMRVVIPASRSGIITGVLLAVARVGGETAPLLMTAFGSTFFNFRIFRPIDALPLRVFVSLLSPYPTDIGHAFAGSFVLMMVIILTSLAVRAATGGFRHR